MLLSRPFPPRSFRPREPLHRRNGKIRAREVRVIDDNKQQLGVMSLNDALRLAQGKELDLIEVVPHATPPVCRIVNYGKFLYEESKKESHARPTAGQMKEIQISPAIGPHDLATKRDHAIRFLCDDMKVRVKLRFREPPEGAQGDRFSSRQPIHQGCRRLRPGGFTAQDVGGSRSQRRPESFASQQARQTPARCDASGTPARSRRLHQAAGTAFAPLGGGTRRRLRPPVWPQANYRLERMQAGLSRHLALWEAELLPNGPEPRSAKAWKYPVRQNPVLEWKRPE